MKLNKKNLIFFVLTVVLIIGATVYLLWPKILLSPTNKYAQQKSYIQILFAGDIMLDRGIKYFADKNGGNNFIFEKISPVLKENDLVVANLEGPITDNKSVSLGTIPGTANNYLFTFDPSWAKTLFDNNIKLVNLGNNHILNFGQAGLNSTKEYLDEANVSYFGAPNGEKNIVKNINGIKIGFVSYNQFENDLPKYIENEIKNLRLQSDIIVVFCHWGNEYLLTATDEQKNLARQFIDTGADLIIGSHPHVIEPIEEYNGKRIYYSLGNFIFDQYFNEDVRNGLGVVVKIDKKTKQLEFFKKDFYLGPQGQTILLP